MNDRDDIFEIALDQGFLDEAIVRVAEDLDLDARALSDCFSLWARSEGSAESIAPELRAGCYAAGQIVVWRSKAEVLTRQLGMVGGSDSRFRVADERRLTGTAMRKMVCEELPEHVATVDVAFQTLGITWENAAYEVRRFIVARNPRIDEAQVYGRGVAEGFVLGIDTLVAGARLDLKG